MLFLREALLCYSYLEAGCDAPTWRLLCYSSQEACFVAVQCYSYLMSGCATLT
jgi:hypothetical protein